MNTPLISIIVPVYNVDKYLRQCVDSILNQTFKYFELILVDDKSPDNSGKICDEYAAYDNRVSVIHKDKNEGLGAARNIGLNVCRGEFIWFIDSDDFLDNDEALQIVWDIAFTQKADVVLFSYLKIFEETGRRVEIRWTSLPENPDKIALLQSNTYKALGWNKVVRFDLINQYKMKFPVGVLGEDLPWCADLLVSATHIAVTDKYLLAYRQRNDSITGNKSTAIREKNIQDTIKLIYECVDKYKINKKTDERSLLIGHFLAYEYSWLIGAVYPFLNKYRKDVKSLAFLLDYDLCEKVKKVRLLYKICRLCLTSFICHIYISKKD